MTEAGEIVVERDLMVPARDGVLLATDVYRPAGPGPFPVLLERTPYDKRRRAGRSVLPSTQGLGHGPRSPLVLSGTAMPSPTRIAAAAIVRAAVSRNI